MEDDSHEDAKEATVNANDTRISSAPCIDQNNEIFQMPKQVTDWLLFIKLLLPGQQNISGM